ncbi:hypothetical protein GVAV_000062 [Gurleya vavrai]
MHKRIEISLLDSDPSQIKQTLQNLLELNIKNIHLDIGDTSFIPNITFGMPFLKMILKHDFEFDLHFMLENPLIIIKQLEIPKNSTITIHKEIKDYKNTINYLKEKHFKIGVAIKPDTEINDFVHIDKLLIMTVEPGYGGQNMILDCIKKIEKYKLLFNGEIGIDGGVNFKNINKVSKADYFVVGSYFFKHENQKKCLDELYEIIFKE